MNSVWLMEKKKKKIFDIGCVVKLCVEIHKAIFWDIKC